MELKDRVVVVTGGANGIGAAIARRFAQERAELVVVADHDATGATITAEAIRKAGGDAEPWPLDVGDEQAVAALVANVIARRGRIDLFCSNAGVFAEGGPDTPDAEWARCWSVNVMAHVYAARAVLPPMLARGEGYILNTASSAGLLTALGAAPYAVTKHAAVAFAEWLAITYGERGIRVSLLCPQAVRTAMLDEATAGSAASAVKSGGVVLTPDHVAGQVIDAVRAEQFLVLTHAEIAVFLQRKADDVGGWIRGMQRFAASAGGAG